MSGDRKPTNSLALAALMQAAAMAAASMMGTSHIMDQFGVPLMDERLRQYRQTRKSAKWSADPAKKAARKRQKSARAKNRKK